jgi:hypothetical protein
MPLHPTSLRSILIYPFTPRSCMWSVSFRSPHRVTFANLKTVTCLAVFRYTEHNTTANKRSTYFLL